MRRIVAALLASMFFIINFGFAQTSEAITIDSSDLRCVEDQDCTATETLCDNVYCECPGEAINKEFESKYQAILNQCRRGKILVACDLVCAPYEIKCIHHVCKIIGSSLEK